MSGKDAIQDLRNSRKWVCYYDGDCGFCTKVVQGLCWIDFCSRVIWKPFQSLKEPPVGLSWDDLDLAAYLDTRNGRNHEGFYAFRLLTIKLLPLVPLAPFFWFPGATLVGIPVYRLVARNRYRISRCGLPGFKS